MKAAVDVAGGSKTRYSKMAVKEPFKGNSVLLSESRVWKQVITQVRYLIGRACALFVPCRAAQRSAVQ